MSTAKAQRVILERLGSGSTVLLSIHLALPDVPWWADGRDANGNAVVLVGRHQLGEAIEAIEAATGVLDALAKGAVPDGVQALSYAPKASEAIATIVDGPFREVLVHGERGTGKTMLVPGALAILAELHARAGFALPLRSLWVHDALRNASVKTGRSLEAPLWGGIWTLREDRQLAVLMLGGVEYVLADFVGSQDVSAAERLRAEAHVVAADEVIASFDDSAGVAEEKYELAITSARLPTRRHVAVAVTNPGSPDCWPFRRFIESGGQPGCVARSVPASDRLTDEEVTALVSAFRDNPELAQRLGRGEWAELKLGPAVTPGFRDEHIAPERLKPVKNVMLWMGHDGGHTPCTIIGARYQGAVLVYAALASERAGTRQHVENLVLPWLSGNAPWCLQSPATLLEHRYDPAMATGEQADIDQDPVSVLRELLGGLALPGAVSWAARLEPVTALFNRFNTHTGRPTLQIDPVEGVLLIRALRGRWYFPTVNGLVSRDLPVKTHPWSDLGDSLAYMVGGMAPSRAEIDAKPKPRPPLRYTRILGALR